LFWLCAFEVVDLKAIGLEKNEEVMDHKVEG